MITMYSKNSGKAGAHSFTQGCQNIGALSYMFFQTYEHSYRRQFKNIRRRDSALGTLRFAHLPSNSFMAIVPCEANTPEDVKIFASHIEIGLGGYKVFEELTAEKELLCKRVASLNTVRRKGKTRRYTRCRGGRWCS
ncbi:hypothetical protein B0H17DRAFT_968528 [Mycena rosella]|uniref:Uncharacterized protein n=1 Tax=Mycena rosella TaxID=1033263 RepID=A0AAD7AY19_MYCRO|nr:hypothetical protein B0H17DRAFT_968528 [Mycena rosella]